MKNGSMAPHDLPNHVYYIIAGTTIKCTICTVTECYTSVKYVAEYLLPGSMHYI